MDDLSKQSQLLDALLATLAATTPETPPEQVRRAFLIIEREVARQAEEEGQL
jgi:hypothetical protein